MQVLVSLSTNGSIFRRMPSGYNARSILYIGFSMPGFSQASYDAIHRFNFEQVRSNIERTISDLYEHGFCGIPIIYFHVYKFNVHEVGLCHKWAKSIGAMFDPYYAFINDRVRMRQYMHGKLSGEYLENVRRDLFMERCVQKWRGKVKPAVCPMMKQIKIDAKGVVRCCCWDDSPLGNLEDFDSPETLLKAHRECRMCKRCMSDEMENFQIITNPLGFGKKERLLKHLPFAYFMHLLLKRKRKRGNEI